jgi:tetratricopeptide (TPR) repeat protein
MQGEKRRGEQWFCDTVPPKPGDTMKSVVLMLALMIAASYPSTGQSFDPTTPDGAMIAAIQKESDAAKKQAMLEEFVQKYPDSKTAGWAWGQLQASYLQGQQYDKAVEAGQKSLASDPDQVDVAYNNLKAAEGKNDPDAVMKWSAETSRLARKEVATPKAGDGKEQIDYAKQVDTYTEYSIYATELKTADGGKVIALVESLEARNPDSPYLGKAYGRYLAALQQQGQSDKAGAAAEKEAQRDPSNEDVLAFLADYDRQKKDFDRSLTYSIKLVGVMQSKATPEGMADGDWQKKKLKLLAFGLWIEGVSYNGKSQYAQADKALRQGLPSIQGEDQSQPRVLFQLGFADFQLGKATKNRAMMQDALKFSQQSAAMKSPDQTSAQNNVKAISAALGARR